MPSDTAVDPISQLQQLVPDDFVDQRGAAAARKQQQQRQEAIGGGLIFSRHASSYYNGRRVRYNARNTLLL